MEITSQKEFDYVSRGLLDILEKTDFSRMPHGIYERALLEYTFINLMIKYNGRFNVDYLDRFRIYKQNRGI